MTKYSYYAVVLDHDTGEFFIDEDFVGEVKDGVIWDSETTNWEFAEVLTKENDIDVDGLWDLREAIRGLNDIIKDRKN